MISFNFEKLFHSTTLRTSLVLDSRSRTSNIISLHTRIQMYVLKIRLTHVTHALRFHGNHYKWTSLQNDRSERWLLRDFHRHQWTEKMLRLGHLQEGSEGGLFLGPGTRPVSMGIEPAVFTTAHGPSLSSHPCFNYSKPITRDPCHVLLLFPQRMVQDPHQHQGGARTSIPEEAGECLASRLMNSPLFLLILIRL